MFEFSTKIIFCFFKQSFFLQNIYMCFKKYYLQFIIYNLQLNSVFILQFIIYNLQLTKVYWGSGYPSRLSIGRSGFDSHIDRLINVK